MNWYEGIELFLFFVGFIGVMVAGYYFFSILEDLHKLLERINKYGIQVIQVREHDLNKSLIRIKRK